jgi:hypothetical protein
LGLKGGFETTSNFLYSLTLTSPYAARIWMVIPLPVDAFITKPQHDLSASIGWMLIQIAHKGKQSDSTRSFDRQCQGPLMGRAGA